MTRSGALKTEGLRRSFRGFVAIDDVSLDVQAGARHALIGPNGAGKTTLINLLTGRAPSGRGRGDARSASGSRGWHAHARVKRGLARTFQLNTLFAGLTVLESVTLAVCERRGTSAATGCGRVSSRRTAVDEAHRLLRSLALDDDAGRLTRELPYGKQRLVEIALALASKPNVLLLDEPAAGVPSGESTAAVRDDRAAAARDDDPPDRARHVAGVPIRADGSPCSRAGRVVTEGPPAEIAADARVRELYLGDDHHV